MTRGDLRIISGGQTGVDQIALTIAYQFGIETGGTAPKHWMTEAGPAPWLVRYGLRECKFLGYRLRTMANVQEGDLTAWFGIMSPGYRCTYRAATALNRPFLDNPSAQELEAALHALNYPGRVLKLTLNVAGNRWRGNPAASRVAETVLADLFSRYPPL